MRLIGNFIWFIAVGFLSALIWIFLGVIICITVIGIPLGIQCFKMGGLVLAPFGKTVDRHFAAHPIINVIWFFNIGIGRALVNYLIGIFFCITIIGIPFGLQCFKFAKLVAFPFGARVNYCKIKKPYHAEKP